MTNRSKFLGGSDMAVILGLSKYKTPFQLWQEKTGCYAPIVSSNAIERGKNLEPLVKCLMEKALHVPIEEKQRVKSEAYPFISGEIDGYIPSLNVVTEFKTANLFTAQKSFGEEYTDQIPNEYIIQCQTYMKLTNTKETFVGVYFVNDQKEYPVLKKQIEEGIHVDMLANDVLRYHIGEFKMFVVQRNDKLIDFIFKEAVKFWDSVTKNTPPDLVNINDILLLLNNKSDPTIKSQEATVDQTCLIEEVLSIKDQIKDLEEKMENIKTTLSLGGVNLTSQQGHFLTILLQNRENVDIKQLRENYPEVWKNVRKQTSFLKINIGKK